MTDPRDTGWETLAEYAVSQGLPEDASPEGVLRHVLGNKGMTIATKDLIIESLDHALEVHKGLLRDLVENLPEITMPPHLSWCTGIETWGTDVKHCACRRSLLRRKIHKAREALEAARKALD